MIKKSFLRLLSVAGACLITNALQANDIEPGKEFYTAIRAVDPIVLDGDLSEWTGSTLLVDPSFSYPKGSASDPNVEGEYIFYEEWRGGTWTGPDDQTSAVQVVYDDENVYLGIIVTDEYHENAANSAWNGDSVQLMVASADRQAQIGLYNYAIGGTEDAGLGDTIIMHEAGPGETEAVIVRDSENKKTYYEIKLPLASMELDAFEPGTQFGLGMAINDGDKDAPGQSGWGGLGAHSIVHGKTPQETALVTLARPNDMRWGQEFHSARRIEEGKKIVLDGVIGKEEWLGIPVLADPEFTVEKGVGSRSGAEMTRYEEWRGGTWTGPNDQTSAVQVAYDDDNVYFAFVVTDEYHENSANSAWNGDSVQLMIANDKTDAQIALYNYALGGVEGALGDVIVMHEAGPGGTEAVVTRDAEKGKTYYEILLPKESMELEKLESGVQFGLGMAINDGDEDAPGQSGWGGLGSHSIVHGKTPQETALVTLDGYHPPTECFASAIAEPSQAEPDRLSFRLNDFGDCQIDHGTVELLVNGEVYPVEMTVVEEGVVDYIHTFDPVFPAGSINSYVIRAKRVGEEDPDRFEIEEVDEFVQPTFFTFTPDMQPKRVDKSSPGFIWRIFHNDIYIHNSLTETELALAGELIDPTTGDAVSDNLANPDVVGPALDAGVPGPAELIEFAIPSVINLNASPPEEGGAGNFAPDLQMPGLPGTNDTQDGADAEVIFYVEMPAGRHTFGVNSDDGFRMEGGLGEQAGTIGEFGRGRGSFDSIMRCEVLQDGIYPIRVIWFNGSGGATIELFHVTEDGTKVLFNDIANGGFPTYRSAPEEFLITEFTLEGDDASLTWQSKEGRYYAVETSSDLQSWETVATEIPSGGEATTYTDEDIPAGVVVGPPGLKGEYWSLDPKAVPTSDNPMHRGDNDGANAGWVDENVFNTEPTGTFVSTDVNYAGDGRNDLTPIVEWLGGDGGSYSGDTSENAVMDDGVIRLTGFYHAASAGEVEITTNSDDGSVIYIDNTVVAQDDNGHGQSGTVGEREGQIGTINFPAAGYYPVDIRYFNGDWTNDAGEHGGANLTTTGLDNLVQSVSDGGQRYYRVRQVAAPALFSTDFEDGAGDWTVVTDSGDDWELGTPNAEGITTAASGVNAWGVNLDGEYSPGTLTFLRSPVIDVSSDNSPKLSFNYFIDSTLEAEGGQIRFLDENGEVLAAIDEIFWGNSGTWKPYSVRFPAAARGGSVIVEFAFLTDGDDEIGVGWYIDDVTID